jgi:hypothetical protein
LCFFSPLFVIFDKKNKNWCARCPKKSFFLQKNTKKHIQKSVCKKNTFLFLVHTKCTQNAQKAQKNVFFRVFFRVFLQKILLFPKIPKSYLIFVFAQKNKKNTFFCAQSVHKKCTKVRFLVFFSVLVSFSEFLKCSIFSKKKKKNFFFAFFSRKIEK